MTTTDIVARLIERANRNLGSSAKVVWNPLLRDAAAEIKNLRAERDALFVLTDRLTAEHDALRAERDEVRQSYCSLMEAYRGGDGRVTANKLGWGYLFPRRPKKEDGK